ncbi:response regulator transcription factor [Aquabacterium sp. OR-4]|uniref:response regulator transcription factor n=1 Tax=Aquabacterium sp. OR-4 TaxID=2978127 RepID=UPI0028C5624F|nr:response regulator transcription factor [Aquabacterium sp. OR-4]MDT7835953.1 response regulator transcription factor [Aquabacterium sp. OR-4]
MNPQDPEFFASAGVVTPEGDVVLIVDDQPDNLAVLHDALDEAGYTVLVATDGASALQRAGQAQPDIVLLDAMMPGMDGFEVARRLKAEPETAAIPIVFMTALTETEHVVAAFGAGGADYVTKPIQPREVLARIAAHLQTAKAQRQARNALDAFGHATLVLRADDGRLVWQTPLARRLLRDHFGSDGPYAPTPMIDWLRRSVAALPGPGAAAVAGAEPVLPLVSARAGRRLTLRLHAMGEPAEGAAEAAPDSTGTADGEWLIVASESNDAALIDAMVQAFRVTAREAEVLYWVAKGKTNRDIGDILGTSPRTITKHMEHILPKLGVETRTAAAGMVLQRLGRLLG